jgi:hypothetical protein
MTYPLALIVVVSEVLAEHYTHDRLNTFFIEAGAPGDVPEGSKRAKCEAWLRRINLEAAAQAPAILGRLLERMMEEDLPPPSAARPSASWGTITADPRVKRYEDRERVKAALAKAGFAYLGNGQMTQGGVQIAVRQLADLIRTRDLPALEAEFGSLASRAATGPEMPYPLRPTSLRASWGRWCPRCSSRHLPTAP